MIPNCITALRIVGTAVLLLAETFSPRYYFIYIFCGITDVLDGMIARLTRTTSTFGAKLDSAADLCFYSVSMIKLLPMLWRSLPRWIWVLVGTVVLTRIICYVLAAVRARQFASLHTNLNKATGAAVFLIPFAMLMPGVLTPFCMVTVLLSAAAAANELMIHAWAGEPKCSQ